MPKLFINYRREDSEAYIARIYERLKNPDQGLEGWEIFRDIDSLGAGDFLRDIQKFLATSDVVLIVIGPRWKEILENRDPATDIARHEIKVALNSDAIVIPVLVGEAVIPELPRDLVKLAGLNTFKVRSDPDFDSDMGRLIQAISPSRSKQKHRNINWIAWGAIATFLTVVATLAVPFIDHLLDDNQSGSSPTAISQGPTDTLVPAIDSLSAPVTTETPVAVAWGGLATLTYNQRTATAIISGATATAAAALGTIIPTFIPLDITARQFEDRKFEQNAARIEFTGGCDETHSNGISVNWDVSPVKSFAGSVIDIPSEVAAVVTEYTHLTLWAESKNESVQFEIGLKSPGGEEHEYRKLVSLSTGENGQIAIPLNTFVPYGVDLTHLTGLILWFDYYNGADSREGTICIGGFGFSSSP